MFRFRFWFLLFYYRLLINRSNGVETHHLRNAIYLDNIQTIIPNLLPVIKVPVALLTNKWYILHVYTCSLLLTTLLPWPPLIIKWGVCGSPRVWEQWSYYDDWLSTLWSPHPTLPRDVVGRSEGCLKSHQRLLFIEKSSIL